MLDCKDFEVLVIALENITLPSKRSTGSPPAGNNASPSSLANISMDPEFTCLL